MSVNIEYDMMYWMVNCMYVCMYVQVDFLEQEGDEYTVQSIMDK